MGKQNMIEKALASIDAQIATLTAARQVIVDTQAAKPATKRKPRKAESQGPQS